MTNQTQPEWTRFAVGKPSGRPNWIDVDCQPLTTVSHVAHVNTAARIIEDGLIRPGLIFDKSKLNTSRIRVVWLSPNDWAGAGGFRYGNIRFSYDWGHIVGGKYCYWVESIAYGVPACRIFITDRDLSQYLDPYDPRRGDGPWWMAPDGTHYWNGNFCLELMVERDLRVVDAARVDFVKHHPQWCCLDSSTCGDMNQLEYVGGAFFLAQLIRSGRPLALPGAVEGAGAGARAAFRIRGAARQLLQMCIAGGSGIAARGTFVAAHPLSQTVARALVAAVANRHEADRLGMLSMFASDQEAADSVAALIATGMGVAGTSQLFPEPPTF